MQTHYPDHPLIAELLREGYAVYARNLLELRRQSGMPPFAYLALVRADARELAEAETLLADLRGALRASGVYCLGPLPAPMTRRAGLYRAQLLLRAEQRAPLHRALYQLCRYADEHPLARRVKWSVDVDPVDLS